MSGVVAWVSRLPRMRKASRMFVRLTRCLLFGGVMRFEPGGAGVGDAVEIVGDAGFQGCQGVGGGVQLHRYARIPSSWGTRDLSSPVWAAIAV